MAARKSLSHDEKTREKIQTSQLINRLTDHAFAKLELTPTQVKAIEILLKKTLPDLKQLEVTGTIATVTHEQWLESLKDE
jgi:hypothetical protein